MPSPNLLILYVSDPVRSSAFYEKLLGESPDAVFPTYASFALSTGLNLGLWSTQAKDFVSCGQGSRGEVAFMVDSEAEVCRLFTAWQALGVEIEQAPTQAVFGLTFVALDLDGHRLRVCLPDA